MARKPLPRLDVLIVERIGPEEVARIIRESPTLADAAKRLGRPNANAVSQLAHELRLDGYDCPKRKAGRPRIHPPKESL